MRTIHQATFIKKKYQFRTIRYGEILVSIVNGKITNLQTPSGKILEIVGEPVELCFDLDDKGWFEIVGDSLTEVIYGQYESEFLGEIQDVENE